MKKPWFMAKGPANIEIKDCVIDGENYSGTLTKQVCAPVSLFCGYPDGEVVLLVHLVEEYRGSLVASYSLPQTFEILRAAAERAEKKALDWEKRCHLKDEEIKRLREFKDKWRDIARLAIADEEVKP